MRRTGVYDPNPNPWNHQSRELRSVQDPHFYVWSERKHSLTVASQTV